MSAAGEWRDPFTPPLPLGTELGRLVTHSTLRPDWRCRWCAAHLSTTPAGGLLCLTCDPH